LWPYIIQTGPNDVVLISELAYGSDVVTMGMAVAASGALSRVEIRQANSKVSRKRLPELLVLTLPGK
jgi:hypothetical protein